MSEIDLNAIILRTISKVNELCEKLPLHLQVLMQAQAELIRRGKRPSAPAASCPKDGGAGDPPKSWVAW